jgi:uncharacterized protein YyaL (SSP411 family)
MRIHIATEIVIFTSILTLIFFTGQINCQRKETMKKSYVRFNHLQNEKSPYLLQHAENPVDWYPWGEDAFQKAKMEDKPIFLSIGYATCHWCHVMELESFEDEKVAALLNETFVCIKVDREERPDVDDVYMTVCQMVTGSGGWPLTIMMTVDKTPFFAATYIPKENRYGRPGMLQLIPKVKKLWDNQRNELLNNANKISDALSQISEFKPGIDLRRELLDEAFEMLNRNYDPYYGGFGNFPKFPTSHNLLFLLRYWNRTENPKPLEMVENTLQKMRWGGVYDQLGFGFHRYSTDREWLLPHFEKMLYDQALIAMAYTEAFQATGKDFYKTIAEEIFTYVLRDMTDSKGGFYSAEDADSEGEEGKFYVWTINEIDKVLEKTEAELIKELFNIKQDGNFKDESTQQKSGSNILHLNKSLSEIATDLKMDKEVLSKKIESARKKLFAVRKKRIHPLKDDKILTDWNGLMIAALAKASRAFGKKTYAEAAEKATDFILRYLMDGDNNLMHRYREEEVAIKGYLDDYAFLIWGLLELYEATFNELYLEKAIALNNLVIEHFWDDKDLGFFFTADDAEELLIRKKSIYDGAVPSGNSVMMLNLIKLGRLTGCVEYENFANSIGKAFSTTVTRNAAAYALLFSAFDFAVGPSYEIVFVADNSQQKFNAMVDCLYSKYVPNKVVIYKNLKNKNSKISEMASFTNDMSSIDGKPTAYICKNFQCELPTTDIDKMLGMLGFGL